ncbi:MAG TPA: NADH-quinone oxidoreductase subunit J, partial [Acidobacteriota bacterium]|nr:NADH-quinone oxidoreductase subunit J [Acidobacteriota bacterium]
IMLGAHFLGVIQIVVYAGAIMVLFVFVIMLLNVRREATHIDHHAYLKPLAGILGLVLLAQLVFVVARVVIPQSPTVSPGVGTVETVGKELLTTYLLPFEATSVLILMAIIGSMHLAKREKE